MGWCGSELADDVWKTVRKYVPKEKRAKIAREIKQQFVYQDCDDWDEEDRLIKDCKYRWCNNVDCSEAYVWITRKTCPSCRRSTKEI